jgi:hypothetical protein
VGEIGGGGREIEGGEGVRACREKREGKENADCGACECKRGNVGGLEERESYRWVKGSDYVRNNARK